nr:MAG TPA: hypothetical protein [Caudoviricetes sp.]
MVDCFDDEVAKIICKQFVNKAVFAGFGSHNALKKSVMMKEKRGGERSGAGKKVQ